MNAQLVWQSQEMEAPRISLAYVRHRAIALEHRTRLRNAAEYVLALVLFGFFGWRVWVEYPVRPIAAAASAWFGLSVVYFAVCWSRLAKSELAPTDAGVLDTLRYQRLQLERQYNARHRSWRWWLAPMVLGFAIMLASNMIEVPDSGWRDALIGIAVITGGLWVTNVFYEGDAERIKREIDALDSLSRD